MTRQARRCGRRSRIAFRIPRLRASSLGALSVSTTIPGLILTAVSGISFSALLLGGDGQGSRGGIGVECFTSPKGHGISARAHPMGWSTTAWISLGQHLRARSPPLGRWHSLLTISCYSYRVDSHAMYDSEARRTITGRDERTGAQDVGLRI